MRLILLVQLHLKFRFRTNCCHSTRLSVVPGLIPSPLLYGTGSVQKESMLRVYESDWHLIGIQQRHDGCSSFPLRWQHVSSPCCILWLCWDAGTSAEFGGRWTEKGEIYSSSCSIMTHTLPKTFSSEPVDQIRGLCSATRQEVQGIIARY